LVESRFDLLDEIRFDHVFGEQYHVFDGLRTGYAMPYDYWSIDPQDRTSPVLLVIEPVKERVVQPFFPGQYVKRFGQFEYHIPYKTITDHNIGAVIEQFTALNISDKADPVAVLH